MQMNRKGFSGWLVSAILLALMMLPLALAQSSKEEPSKTDVNNDDGEEKTTQPAEAPASSRSPATKNTSKTFKPTEKIGAGDAVSFPVDI